MVTTSKSAGAGGHSRKKPKVCLSEGFGGTPPSPPSPPKKAEMTKKLANSAGRATRSIQKCQISPFSEPLIRGGGQNGDISGIFGNAHPHPRIY